MNLEHPILLVPKEFWDILRGHMDYLLLKTMNTEQKRITVYCDFDYAGDPDNKRSTTGYCVYLGGNLVKYCIKEAKYYIKYRG